MGTGNCVSYETPFGMLGRAGNMKIQRRESTKNMSYVFRTEAVCAVDCPSTVRVPNQENPW